ncbi:MAG: hypothetical protein HY481_01130 [Candidatus Vogelbacteria bacterium]|nr:hypothetical protein [Candidatus Vogelbacteria bacterium]
MTASQVCDSLRPDQTYEWAEVRSALALTRIWDRAADRKFLGPRLIKFRQGLCLGFVPESNEFLFRVDALAEDQRTVVGQEVVLIRILEKKHLPRPLVKGPNN